MLLLNSRLKLVMRKHKTKWLGLFIVADVYLSQEIDLEGHEKKVIIFNRSILKHYHVGCPGAAKVELL